MEFIDIELLGTVAGCSFIVTLLTQIFKKYLPSKVDTKWLALVFSIIIGVLRILYIQQFDFAGIVTGILNIFVLLTASIGIYEVANPITNGVKNVIEDFNNDLKGGDK